MWIHETAFKFETLGNTQVAWIRNDNKADFEK